MKAVYNREWRSYFHSPKGYIFAAIFIALCSFYFINGALIYQSADLSIVFSNMNVVYIFLVSILTMGLFSNERSRKTDQLLLTSPVSVVKIVCGKYFAAMTAFGITLALSLVYPFILTMFGTPSLTEMIGSYIGFILLWAVFVAIGMFVSANTENQMIAAVITFGILLGVFYFDVLTANISSVALLNVLKWFSLLDRYTEFGTGIVNVESVVYYISFVFVFIFLTAQVIKRRQSSDVKVRANNVIVTVVVIAGTILVNAIVSTVATKTPLKIDMTQEGIYEYSDETKTIVASLDADVELYALYPEDADSSYSVTMKEYLEQYEQMGDKIKVIYKDPYMEPAFVRQYGENVSVGSVIAVCGERSKVVPFEELYIQSQQSGAMLIDAEKQLTSAIQYVSGKSQTRTAYFTRRHDEYAGADSDLATELKNNGYNTGEINISSDGIPEDADLIIMLAPAVDLTAEERDAIDKYVLNGGKLAVVLSPGIEPMERLYSYLEEWGITVNNDFVIENDPSMAFRSQSGIPVPAPEIQSHPLTDDVRGRDIAFIAPNSCSLTLNDNNVQNVTVEPLLKTSENSWGIKDLSRTTLDMEDGDIPGPLTISAIAEKPSVGGGKIFVIGSLAAVGTGNILNDSSYCNGDFALDTFSYLAGKGESVNIRAKKISAETLVMTEQQLELVSMMIQYILPILIVLMGVVIWVKKKASLMPKEGMDVYDSKEKAYTKYYNFGCCACDSRAAYVFVLNWDVNEEEQKTKELTYVVLEDTENISSVHIKNPSSEYDIVLTKKENGAVTYSVSGMDGRNINGLQLENTVMSLSQMISNKTLSIDKAGLAEFGLAAPQNSYTLNMKNGETVTVLLGDEIPTSGEFYCMVKGGTDVYVVNSYSVSAVMAKPEDYISTAIFDFNDATTVNCFTLWKNNQEVMSVCADEKSDGSNGNYISGVWKMTYPWSEDVDNEKFTLLLNDIIAVDAKATADNVQEAVSNYEVEISTAEKTYRFSVGGTTPEGDVYFKYGEECYVIDSSIFNLLESVNPDDYLVKLVNLVYMDDVENVTIGYDGKDYKLEPVGKNGTSYVVNGKSVEETQFKKLYQTFVGILYTQHTDIKTEEEPYLTITYVYKSGECEEIKFYKYDERSMIAIRPNGTGVMVLSSEIKKITDLLS